MRPPRSAPSHSLTFLLCALLAFPANLPTLDRDGSRPEGDPSTPSKGENHGVGLRRPDRRAGHGLVDWSVDADEPLTSDGRDDSRYTPFALTHSFPGLPSLVPAPLESRARRPASPAGSDGPRPPLRC